MSGEESLSGLVARVQRLEDELAIIRKLTAYGPLVDAGEADAAAALWTEDGVYDVEGWRMAGRAELRAMVRSDAHQDIIGGGSAHFFGPPHIERIEGDEAEAFCESILVRHEDGKFYIWRAGVHRIELRRTSDGWCVTRRVTRPLNGSAEARKLVTGMPGS
ncbi:nuclear transport factor 2 family protein [Nocardia flavorosea]|uniref:Nuclear transport factor 2 family protein n=1 Tax=Nocardia flavorosea TaxID=53429 RepID=A0A846YSS1_9NOCA|nr:nuclear transport factor 2 family protein [Nocardia flavorosea]NKY60721.1 nuclear transport factor 2 family protein [Nocardia flavorosea]